MVTTRLPRIALGARIGQLERRQHALLSARVTLQWEGPLVLPTKVNASFLAKASFGCSLLDCTIDSTGVTPLIMTRFHLDEPLDFSERAQNFGSNLIAQADLIPPNPIVGVVVFPAALETTDPEISRIVNVINQLMPAGTHTIFDLHVEILRGG